MSKKNEKLFKICTDVCDRCGHLKEGYSIEILGKFHLCRDCFRIGMEEWFEEIEEIENLKTKEISRHEK